MGVTVALCIQEEEETLRVKEADKVSHPEPEHKAKQTCRGGGTRMGVTLTLCIQEEEETPR